MGSYSEIRELWYDSKGTIQGKQKYWLTGLGVASFISSALPESEWKRDLKCWLEESPRNELISTKPPVVVTFQMNDTARCKKKESQTYHHVACEISR